MTSEAQSDRTLSHEQASRFLSQASFGPTEASVAAVRRLGLEGWFLDQLATPRRPMLPRFEAAEDDNRHYVYPLFWEGAIHGADQLRQRVAYALSRIIVVSLAEMGRYTVPFVAYADHLASEAFGSYGALLRRVTYSPAMGHYLSHLGNQKADPETGSAPDENYARELMQLFTIGVAPLTPGGEVLPGESYTNADVEGLAAIMTGLSWARLERFHGNLLKEGDPRRRDQMDAYPVAHEQGLKRFLGYEAKGPNPIEAIDGALAHLMAHANTPPFVCRRLIQALVTSNPAPSYVARVGAAFARGTYALPSGREVGAGERGDMTATVAAILFDEAARSPARLTADRFGRLREPTLRMAHLVRAFAAPWDPASPIEPLGPITYSYQQAEFAEQAWYAPSVFGSFSADYQATGTDAERGGLVSPEMQVQNTASAMGYLRRVSDLIRTPMRGVLTCDFSPLFEAVREGPEAATDLVSRVFFHDAMAPDTRRKYLDLYRRFETRGQLEADREVQQRVELSLCLAMTDPAFAVQR